MCNLLPKRDKGLPDEKDPRAKPGGSAMDEALRALSRRRMSVAKLRSHLQRKRYPAEEIEECLNRLEEWGYLDDLSYARDLVERTMTRAPVGIGRLLWELRTKGIPEAIAEEVASEVLSSVSERELCEKAARNYLASKRGTAGRNRRVLEDTARYLMRRGFDDETVFLVVSELSSDVDLPEAIDSVTDIPARVRRKPKKSRCQDSGFTAECNGRAEDGVIAPVVEELPR